MDNTNGENNTKYSGQKSVERTTVFNAALNASKAQRNEAIRDAIKVAYCALKDKGYRPVNQIVDYLASGDPIFITSNQDARAKITSFDRDDILAEVIRYYLAGIDAEDSCSGAGVIEKI